MSNAITIYIMSMQIFKLQYLFRIAMNQAWGEYFHDLNTFLQAQKEEYLFINEKSLITSKYTLNYFGFCTLTFIEFQIKLIFIFSDHLHISDKEYLFCYKKIDFNANLFIVHLD